MTIKECVGATGHAAAGVLLSYFLDSRDEPLGEYDPAEWGKATGLGALDIEAATDQLEWLCVLQAEREVIGQTPQGEVLASSVFTFRPGIVRWLLEQSTPGYKAGERLGQEEWNDLRRRIFRRDGNRCRYCFTTCGPFHIDHIEPLRRGGDNHTGNLCVACTDCNLSKGAKEYPKWMPGHISRYMARFGCDVEATANTHDTGEF